MPKLNLSKLPKQVIMKKKGMMTKEKKPMKKMKKMKLMPMKMKGM